MSQKPVRTIRFGRVTVSVWANESSNGIFHNVTLQRSYRDGDEWKQSASFGRDDLPLVAKAIDMAHTWIFQQS